MFPLPLKEYAWPGVEGQFGAVRKHDIHTGVDLYCAPRTPVYSIGAGVVTAVEDFTGPKAGSPWWCDTKSVLVYNSGMYGGTVCYGEIEPVPYIKPGSMLSDGFLIGHVKTVLKKNKGKPMTMLHFELYKDWVKESVVWKLDTPKPEALRDPTDLLNELRGFGMKDLMGQPIRVGDLVANCVMNYRRASLRLGVVKEVSPRLKIGRSTGSTGTVHAGNIVVLRWDQISPDQPDYQKLIDMRDSLI